MARGSEVVTVFIREADAAFDERNWGRGVARAERAVRAARLIGDALLIVRALYCEARGLWNLDRGAAVVRYTEILALAEAPDTRDKLDNASAAWYVAYAYCLLVDALLTQTSTPYTKLLDVLDVGEQWRSAAGRHEWRATFLYTRARVHGELGDYQEAYDLTREAIDAWSPGTPGRQISAIQYLAGWYLRELGRRSEARSHFGTVLDDQSANDEDRALAQRGFALCALDDRQRNDALRHAKAALQLAEASNQPGTILNCMDTLVKAHRAAGDPDEAWRVACDSLGRARRDGHVKQLYFAEFRVIEVALDRGDKSAARRLLKDLREHAGEFDRAEGGTRRSRAITALYRRLGDTPTPALPAMRILLYPLVHPPLSAVDSLSGNRSPTTRYANAFATKTATTQRCRVHGRSAQGSVSFSYCPFLARNISQSPTVSVISAKPAVCSRVRNAVGSTGL